MRDIAALVYGYYHLLAGYVRYLHSFFGDAAVRGIQRERRSVPVNVHDRDLDDVSVYVELDLVP